MIKFDQKIENFFVKNGRFRVFHIKIEILVKSHTFVQKSFRLKLAILQKKSKFWLKKLVFKNRTFLLKNCNCCLKIEVLLNFPQKSKKMVKKTIKLKINNFFIFRQTFVVFLVTKIFRFLRKIASF